VSEQLSTPTAPAVPFDYDGRLVIAVNVSDLERSLEWYREMLGFEVTYKLDEYGWAEISSPIAGVTIGLGQVENPEVKGNTPTWAVKDMDAARGHLESKGVRFDGETNNVGGMVLLATFYDPDGNSWMLAQNLDTEYRNE
jgi:catechol 2,3-dioxygenase-like lactoylglutathione lyase family enzyme